MNEPDSTVDDPQALDVEMSGISLSFGAVRANRDVDLSVRRGEIHALVGENGAGKSTLMRILFGLLRPDQGSIRIQGRDALGLSPRRAMSLGMGMVHQHFMLVETATVAENVFLGLEPRKGGIFLDRSQASGRVAEVSRTYELDVDPDVPVETLAVGVRQRVEILKALVRGAQILILDEPTAVLTPGEVEALFVVLRRLRNEGKTVVLITHKLDEVLAISDRVTVLRAGAVAGMRVTAETSAEDLSRLMVGRDVHFQADRIGDPEKEPVLEVSNLTVRGAHGRPALDRVTLAVHRREILGIAGVDGNGQAELAASIMGLIPAAGGSVRLLDLELSGLSTAQRIDRGIAHIPQDRLVQAMVSEMPLWENFLLGRHRDPAFCAMGLLRSAEVRRAGLDAVEQFDVRPPNPDLEAGSLSGGNQQKLVAAREIGRNAPFLIAAHPTRGLDIAATAFLHEQLLAQRNQGVGVLLISAELSEILTLSDRVAVLHRGRIVRTFDSPPTREEAGLAMAGDESA